MLSSCSLPHCSPVCVFLLLESCLENLPVALTVPLYISLPAATFILRHRGRKAASVPLTMAAEGAGGHFNAQSAAMISKTRPRVEQAAAACKQKAYDRRCPERQQRFATPLEHFLLCVLIDRPSRAASSYTRLARCRSDVRSRRRGSSGIS